MHISYIFCDYYSCVQNYTCLKINWPINIDNLIVSDAIENVKRGVFSGIDLSKLFLKEVAFPPQFGQLIAVGEKTGNLE